MPNRSTFRKNQFPSPTGIRSLLPRGIFRHFLYFRAGRAFNVFIENFSGSENFLKFRDSFYRAGMRNFKKNGSGKRKFYRETAIFVPGYG